MIDKVRKIQESVKGFENALKKISRCNKKKQKKLQKEGRDIETRR